MSQSRQLAAIMFTDIAGYTALMSEDEQKAFELLKKNRSIQRPIIEKFNGRWIKEIGDGVLASFSTVSDAIYCAKEIQETCLNEPDLNLRIGIHLGEVVFEGSDVFGEGVNIASRLEPLAPVGGILISESVHNNLTNKKNIDTSYLGEKQLKNVKKPVKVYQIHIDGLEPVATAEPVIAKPQASPSTIYAKKIALISLAVIAVLVLAYFIFPYQSPVSSQIKQPELIDKTIAVLPFKNDSPDADNQYFADGMMDEILNHLQKIAELGVKSRTAVEPYRNSTLGFTSIAQELEVAFILEGAVRKYRDRFRITTQLIEVASGNHLWSETYDGVFSDTIFVVQANIAKKIASSLHAVITPEAAESIDKIPTNNIAAYDLYIKADYERYHYTGSFDKGHSKAAHDLYNQVLRLDPNYVLAITGKADLFATEQMYDSALIYAERAIEIDPNFNRGYASKAFYYGFTGQPDLFEEYILKAINLPPYDDFWLSYHSNLGNFYAYRRNDAVKALTYLKKGLEKEENQYIIGGYSQIIRFYRQIGDYENANHYIRKLMDAGGDCGGIRRYQQLLTIQGKFKEALNFINSKCEVGDCDRVCTQSLFELSWLMGRYEQAEEYFLQWNETQQPRLFYQSENYEIGYVYFQLGRTKKADQIFEEAQQDLQARLELQVNTGRNTLGTHLNLSRIYAFQGKQKEALEHLAEYARGGFFDGWHDFILIDPFFKSLRDNPEFKAIVQQAQQEKVAQRAQIKQMEERGELTL